MMDAVSILEDSSALDYFPYNGVGTGHGEFIAADSLSEHQTDVVLDSGGYEHEEKEESVSDTLVYSSDVETAILGLYDDIHFFLYGFVPFVLAVVFVYVGCKMFFKTFLR